MQAQKQNMDELAWADSMLVSLYKNEILETELSFNHSDKVYKIYQKHGETCKMIKAAVKSAGYMDVLGKTDLAINRLLECLRVFKSNCDSLMLMEIYINLSSTCISVGDYEKTLQFATEGLNSYNENWNSKQRLGLLNNQGIAMASLGKYKDAEQSFRSLYKESSSRNETAMAEQALVNIGTLFGIAKNLDSAYFYFHQDLISLEKRGDFEGMADLKLNLAVMLRTEGKYSEALKSLTELKNEAISRANFQNVASAELELSATFNLMGQHDSAYRHLTAYLSLKDSIINQERVKSIAEMQEKYETVKKAKEIDELKVINLNAALSNEKVKRTRNGMYAGASLLLISLVFLYLRYRTIRKNRNQLFEKNITIAKEKKRSDDLLKNILPDEVAEELKEFGKAKAQDFEMVTIFFSDFKGFTSISERLSASELVGELDICFQAFDHIVTKYNLEKIKTIGDAYMAVGGLPDRTHHNALHVILAALEMQQFMIKRKIELTAKGWLGFEMRVGIHSGPVVAGVVGVKKFQYDVWGDSVNTASRMESSGEINKVNISEATYELIKNTPNLNFEYRGKVIAKNKGELSMYFVGLSDTVYSSYTPPLQTSAAEGGY